jgi:hypothetical protein
VNIFTGGVKMKTVLSLLMSVFASSWVYAFDMSVDRMPANYKGDSVKKVFDKLGNVVDGKREYETTEQYKERASKYKTDGMFVLSPVSIEYNADKGKFNITPNLYYDDKKVILVSKQTRNGSYKGQNAFGVKMTCYKIKESIVMMENRSNDFTVLKRFEIPVDVEKAKAVKKNIALLYITKDCDSLYMGEYLSSCKIDNPFEIRTNTGTITCDVLDLWIFNRKTGEIYYKQGDKNTKEAYYKDGKKIEAPQ